MNNIIGIMLIGSVLLFVGIAFFFFLKRFTENKDKIKKISQDNVIKLSDNLDEELKKKKDEETLKLEEGNTDTIREVVERVLKSSKIVGFIKDQTYNLHDKTKISFLINMSGKDDMVEAKKHIILKNGEILTQNKHYLVIKKEYSEKVFLCAYKIIEEMYNIIPTVFRIWVNIHISDENDENKSVCVLSVEATRDDYKSVKNRNISVIQKIDTFNAKYNYDTKNYDLFEIDPIATPKNVLSLEKTMATKATTSTSFFGNGLIDSDGNKSEIDNNTKIETIKNASIQMTQQDLGNILLKHEENTSDIDKILNKYEFNLVKKEELNPNIFEIIACDKNNTNVLINYSKIENIVKEDKLKELFFKAIKQNITKYIYISTGSFSLDAVNYANVNGIEILDGEKLNKILS